MLSSSGCSESEFRPRLSAWLPRFRPRLLQLALVTEKELHMEIEILDDAFVVSGSRHAGAKRPLCNKSLEDGAVKSPSARTDVMVAPTATAIPLLDFDCTDGTTTTTSPDRSDLMLPLRLRTSH